MKKSSNGSGVPTSLLVDVLADAAGYLQWVIGHHDSLAARIDEQVATRIAARVTVVGSLRRQLRVQIAIVEAATEVVDELFLSESMSGTDIDQAKIESHRLQLLKEIRGLANRSVPV